MISSNRLRKELFKVIRKVTQNLVISFILLCILSIVNFVIFFSTPNVEMRDVIDLYKDSFFNYKNVVILLSLIFFNISVLRFLVDYFRKKA